MSAAEPDPGGERGQGTVEWVGLLLLVGVLFAALVAAGARVPLGSLARSIATRVLCATSLSDACREAPQLVAAYGEELAALVRRHVPTLAYEDGMRALPVDFRRCRSPACADGREAGVVTRSLAGEPVVAFVHVVDCRPAAVARTERRGGDCSEERRGNLYLQYWTYYPDSATLRGVPVAGGGGYHRDDWEGTQFRIGADGTVEQRASSHNGYNCEGGAANWGSDAGIGILEDAAEAVGARPPRGWCEASAWLFVSGGSHAGNVRGDAGDFDRITPGKRVRLVPLEPIAVGAPANFAVSAPWVKEVWSDPEAEGTS
jgi:hypothetical protein